MRQVYSGLAALLVLALSVFAVHAADAPRVVKSASLTLDASKPGVVIDRHIFGQFVEHLGHGVYEGVWVGAGSAIPNTRGIRNDVVAALKAIKVPVVRWPGGCFADEYHWRNGIGPADKRRAGLNPNWGGVVEPNTFGTHEFMDFVGQIGAEAYLSVNVGTGTPQEAAEWLEYMTSEHTALAQERAANGHPAPYKVAFWGIGNESWGCGGAMSADYYLNQLKIYSRFSRNYLSGQKMEQIAVGPDGGKTEYTETIMKAWRDKVWSWNIDGLSLHSYTVNGWPPAKKATGFGEDEYASFIKETVGMDDLIKTHAAIMDKYDPAKKIALVVDEWGSWLAPAPGSKPGFLMQQNSQRDAILTALNFNIFARHADRVRMTNIAQMVNVLQAMILTDKERMLLTPTYHVFKMYVPFQDAQLIPVSIDAGTYTFADIHLPRVDAIAARDKAGKLWLALTNVDPNAAVDITIKLSGAAASIALGETLTAPRIDAVNTFAAPDTVATKPAKARIVNDQMTLKLAPQSVTVLGLQ